MRDYKDTPRWAVIQATNHGAKGYAFTGGEHFRHRGLWAILAASASWAVALALVGLALAFTVAL